VTSGDGTVRLWDLATRAQPQERQALNHHLVGFSPDGTGLFTLHTEPPTGVVELHCWHQETGTSSLLGEIAASAQDLAVERGGNGASASAKGDRIAVGMKNGTVRVWDVGARRLQEDLLVEQDVPIQVVAFHPLKNDVLATGGRNGLVQIWNLRTRELLATLPGPGDKVMSLCLSPTDDLIGIGKRRFQVFSLDSAKELFSQEGECITAQFSPDGKHVAASDGWVVHLWEVKTGKVIAKLKGQFASTDSLSFSPDGKTLATGNNDWTVKLWHVQSGTEMMTFHASGMARVLFSRNDQQSSLAIGGLIGGLYFHWNEPFQTLPVPSLMTIDAERLGAPQ
jgi:WD40 repeat protein